MPFRGGRDLLRVADDDRRDDFTVLGDPHFLQDFGGADRGAHTDPAGPQAPCRGGEHEIRRRQSRIDIQ